MIKVIIIGAGNVATHLYKSFTKTKQLDIIQVFNRDIDHLDFVDNASKKVSDISKLKEADLYLIAIKDEAIEEITEKLDTKNGIVVHTSGSQPLQILSKFKNSGVFYPLQTFSKIKPVNFKEIPLCLEANSEENLEYLKNIASLISDKIFEVNSEQRKALHVSAVFVNNFSNHLFTLAADFCKKEELPFDILRPLIKETVDKLETLDPYSAQTGPALRNDKKTISAHLEMLDEDRKKIYTLLTESIQKLHGKKL
ncbi:Rossmann-like and DUF2520 domain-containing protein [Christiangramia forsetii]|uniref:DUF2520 domain-containing protein n=2 Tax=Christiangramia forsetii TaxID=411153 RepID=A0M2D5_CHRFK|nr:Rossmann-like and DUF2520 domain-containing protein [Christiangramia forsetii]GGG39405.1 hypothetical protein GCM10011532_23970 [Christiangramia forsetii]CAL66780.1 conserved hypothetical protein [Christiangramia forsetii KT0803]